MGLLNISSNKEGNLNQMEDNAQFENIKSKYILQIIFEYLTKDKILQLIRYNKATQKRLGINLKDYREYSRIEIEIIPLKYPSGRFINIKKEDNLYYHIYFNGGGGEIKRIEFNKDDNVSKINIIIDYKIRSLAYLFSNCGCIRSIHFKNFKRSNINNMTEMFSFCKSLEKINFSDFNTDNVTNMNNIFHGCSSLKEINLSNFNTINVNTMRSMFSGCFSLEKINLDHLNTSNVTNMSFMFSECGLTEINLSNFNTDNVIDMRWMFSKCNKLKKINISNFNTNNVTNISGMFYGCNSLKEINLPNFNADNEINMKAMFVGCSEELKEKIRTQYNYIKNEAF